MTATNQPAAMTDERLESIEQAHVGDYLGYGWTQDYIEADGDEHAYYRVATTDGTVVATMPDWAGGIALFLAEAHDAVPQLIAEIRRLRATVAAVTVWSAYEEDGEGELYTSLDTAKQGAIAIWANVCRQNDETIDGPYTWTEMKNGGYELLDGPAYTSVYVAECTVHASPVDYTAVRECGCPARVERHAYGCKETAK